jgi:hypothetical protein
MKTLHLSERCREAVMQKKQIVWFPPAATVTVGRGMSFPIGAAVHQMSDSESYVAPDPCR